MHQSPSHLSAQPTAYAVARELFHHGANAGRTQLSPTELDTLLTVLGCQRSEDSVTAANSGELLLRLSNSREFGIVISAALAGSDAALDAGNFRPGKASIHAIAELSSSADFLQRLKPTLMYQKMAQRARQQKEAMPDEQLALLCTQLLRLAADAASENKTAAYGVQALELTLTYRDRMLLVCDARCTFAEPPAQRLARPIAKIDKLLHPATIGIVGVSATGMNFGRIILRNLVASGYPKTQLTIIRDGETEIDGVPCAASLSALTHKLDLLIVAVAAQAVPALADEIIHSGAVESVMLIPGGLGETSASREVAATLAARINAAHAKVGGGPIFLGANCLGVVSHPGAYDSWFIPLERLPKPQKKTQRNSVMLSQSGAFMITRLSQNPWLDPAYMLALGNQTDLTHGDLLSYFADRAEIETIGIYIEGFKDGDGLDFARAVRRAVLGGKQVVLYKAGKTEPGAAGVMGHTASIAGDAVLFEAVLRQAGAIVAQDLNAFDDLFYMAGALHHNKIGGNRLGAISGAGFEAVGMADAITTDSFSLQMGELHSDTVKRIEEVLRAKRLDALVEVRNPIDINPGADDEAHLQIAAAFLADAQIDAVVIGLDPTAPSVRALEASLLRPGYDMHDASSTVQLMPPLVAANTKPLIGIIDGGRLYDAMAGALMDQGVCVFRNCARGTRALVQYVEARLAADALRAAHGNPRP